MNKSISKKTIVLFALVYNATIFGMHQQLITYNQEPFTIFFCSKHLTADIMENTLAPKLSKKNIVDLRLVNRALAKKNPQWEFMPDSVEKEIDAMKEKYRRITSQMKTLLLCKFAYENNNKAVQWLIHVNTPNIEILLNGIGINPSMFALHNNNDNMQKLLIESNEEYFVALNRNLPWKVCQKTIRPPTEIKRALYPSNAHDFSFLPYMIVVPFDDQNALKQLYLKQIPTYSGQKILIELALQYNAHNCFGFFLENETAKEVIKEEPFYYFNDAVVGNHKQIAQQLIDHELYDMHEKDSMTGETILNLYNYAPRFDGSGYDNTRALLEDLKKYQDDKKKQQHQTDVNLSLFNSVK
jgi:hypothetical protein